MELSSSFREKQTHPFETKKELLPFNKLLRLNNVMNVTKS